jgi:CheY-like chemotaxis protein
MPEMDGWELARRLRETGHASAAILVISAHPDNPAAQFNLRRLRDAFLPKPVDLNALLDALGEQLGLTWTDAAPPVSASAGEPVPASLRPHLEELERLIAIGHVSALRLRLDALATAHPADVPFIDLMRRGAEAFRLDELADMIQAARRESVADV